MQTRLHNVPILVAETIFLARKPFYCENSLERAELPVQCSTRHFALGHRIRNIQEPMQDINLRYGSTQSYGDGYPGSRDGKPVRRKG